MRWQVASDRKPPLAGINRHQTALLRIWTDQVLTPRQERAEATMGVNSRVLAVGIPSACPPVSTLPKPVQSVSATLLCSQVAKPVYSLPVDECTLYMTACRPCDTWAVKNAIPLSKGEIVTHIVGCLQWIQFRSQTTKAIDRQHRYPIHRADVQSRCQSSEVGAAVSLLLTIFFAIFDAILFGRTKLQDRLCKRWRCARALFCWFW